MVCAGLLVIYFLGRFEAFTATLFWLDLVNGDLLNFSPTSLTFITYLLSIFNV